MRVSQRSAAAALLGVIFTASATALAAGSTIAESAVGGGDIVAQAKGTSLAGDQIRAIVAALPAAERSAVVGNLQALEQVVHADLVRRAMLTELKDSRFDQQPDTIAQMTAQRDDTLLRLWISRETTVPAGYPGESDIQAAYTANRQALTSPAQYHLAQIFVMAPDGGDPAKLSTALSKANAISTRIATGDFAQLAHQYSDDVQSADKAGDLGFLPEDRMLPAIAAAVRNLEPGQVVGPIKTAQGLHFLKLLEKKPGALPTLPEVHDRLASALRARRAAQLQQQYLTAYDAKLGVTINQIELAKLQSTLGH